MLKQSAEYPRDFGLAVANMMLPRGPRSSETVDLESYSSFAGDDRGALDDMLKGSNRAWWRKL